MNRELPPTVPEIPVTDMNAALDYYSGKLGFNIDWGESGGGIAGISNGQCRLFLTDSQFRTQSGNAPPVIIWLNLDSNEEVDELHRIWNANGVNIVSPPESKPWLLHEFTASDPDGNLFRVFHDFSREGNEKPHKHGLALLLWFPFFMGGMLAGVKLFLLLQSKALSGVEPILLFGLLMVCGLAGMSLGTIAWMLLMRPFYNRDEMRFLFFARGGNIPVLTTSFNKVIDLLYRPGAALKQIENEAARPPF